MASGRRISAFDRYFYLATAFTSARTAAWRYWTSRRWARSSSRTRTRLAAAVSARVSWTKRNESPKATISNMTVPARKSAVAKERMAAQGLKNVTFQLNEHDDLQALQDNSFDAATCRLDLMFMPDPVRMLKSIRRVLKPGGKASAVVWGPPEKAGHRGFRGD